MCVPNISQFLQMRKGCTKNCNKTAELYAHAGCPSLHHWLLTSCLGFRGCSGHQTSGAPGTLLCSTRSPSLLGLLGTVLKSQQIFQECKAEPLPVHSGRFRITFGSVPYWGIACSTAQPMYFLKLKAKLKMHYLHHTGVKPARKEYNGKRFCGYSFPWERKEIFTTHFTSRLNPERATTPSRDRRLGI